MKLVYIAGPYTAHSDQAIDLNIDAAEETAGAILRSTEKVFPVVPHSLGRNFKRGPGSPQFWYDATLEVASRCDAILMLPGWENSKGSKAELAAFLNAGKPVFHRVPQLVAWVEGQA